MRPLRRRALVAAALSIALLLAVGLSRRARPRQPATAPTVATRDRHAAARQIAARERSDTAEPLPRSLRDTEIDGWVGADDDGRLVITPGLRWFFDYFLSATGEESAEDLRARIVTEIERRLPPTAAQEATDLLDRYLSYRDQVRALQASAPTDDLAHRLANLHRIRVDTFGGDDAAALFGEEELVQSIDLQRGQIVNDETLSPEERQRRIDELEQQLPAPAREARDAAMAPARLARDERQLRDAGGSPDEVRALREQRFGSAAADRLASLDRERTEWDRRLAEYRRDRQAIERDVTLDEAARARALEALLSERFTAQERIRAEALVAEN